MDAETMAAFANCQKIGGGEKCLRDIPAGLKCLNNKANEDIKLKRAPLRSFVRVDAPVAVPALAPIRPVIAPIRASPFRPAPLLG